MIEKKQPPRRLHFALLVPVFFVSIISWSSIHAHKLGQSYVFLRVYDNALTGTFEITLRDLNKAMNLSEPDNTLTDANLYDRVDEIHAYYQEKVQFYNANERLPFRLTGIDKRDLAIGRYVLLDFSVTENTQMPEAIEVDYKVLFDQDPDHVGLLVIEHYWNASLFNNESQVSLIFSPSNHRQELSFSGHTKLNGFLGVVKLGTKHIWKGIDHILFLIALILPSTMRRRGNRWEPVTEFRAAMIYVVKIVTLFTIAHSVTLSIAALGIFDLPSGLVEPIIAASIAFAALDIIFPIFKRRIGWVVFVFGLFHGFGFASVLADLGVLGENMALSLLGFNLGVEIGQVVIICVIFPLIYVLRQFAFYPKIIMRYGAAAMILVATFWFVERTIVDFNVTRLIKNFFVNMTR